MSKSTGGVYVLPYPGTKNVVKIGFVNDKDNLKKRFKAGRLWIPGSPDMTAMEFVSSKYPRKLEAFVHQALTANGNKTNNDRAGETYYVSHSELRKLVKFIKDTRTDINQYYRKL